MANLGFWSLVVFCLVCTVSGFQYKCHRDICDSKWQFCNEGEERCNVCTLEQCESDVAQHIFNQCEEKCKELQKTSTVKPSTEVNHVTTYSPALEQKNKGFDWQPLLVVLLAGVLVLLVVQLIMTYLTNKRVNQILLRGDVESGGSSSTLSHTVVSVGETEKRPLLESTRFPDVSDSDRHQNKMGDIRILAQATTEGNQASAPPSYSTDDNIRESSPVKQVSTDQDNILSEKLGDTDFLTSNLQSGQQPEISEDITRPKAV